MLQGYITENVRIKHYIKFKLVIQIETSLKRVFPVLCVISSFYNRLCSQKLLNVIVRAVYHHRKRGSFCTPWKVTQRINYGSIFLNYSEFPRILLYYWQEFESVSRSVASKIEIEPLLQFVIGISGSYQVNPTLLTHSQTKRTRKGLFY